MSLRTASASSHSDGMTTSHALIKKNVHCSSLSKHGFNHVQSHDAVVISQPWPTVTNNSGPSQQLPASGDDEKTDVGNVYSPTRALHWNVLFEHLPHVASHDPKPCKVTQRNFESKVQALIHRRRTQLEKYQGPYQQEGYFKNYTPGNFSLDLSSCFLKI